MSESRRGQHLQELSTASRLPSYCIPLIRSSALFNTAPSFCFASVCWDTSVLDKNWDYTTLKRVVRGVNPKVTGSSLEMLIVNTFRNIMEKESDMPGHISVFCTVTPLILHIYPESFKPFLSLLLSGIFFCKREPYDFSSIRGKSFVSALCWVALPEPVVCYHPGKGACFNPTPTQKIGETEWVGGVDFELETKMSLLYFLWNIQGK